MFILMFYVDVNQALDWTVCHGRAVALSYALFDAPGKLFEAVDEDNIIDAVIKYSSNDRVCSISLNKISWLTTHP